MLNIKCPKLSKTKAKKGMKCDSEGTRTPSVTEWRKTLGRNQTLSNSFWLWIVFENVEDVKSCFFS